jgi:putative transposase
MVEQDNKQISIRRQCELLSVSRSRLYYCALAVNEENLMIMNLIDEEFTDHPFTGIDRMVEFLWREHGLIVNHKRVRRLMRKMGLMAVYPKPRTSCPATAYIKYPCLLRTVAIDAPDMVWCSDITYIRLRGGFMYLVAIMDYFSRYVLSWSVSNSLESLFCLDALDEALSMSRPQIFHSDQGKQYTSAKFVDALKDHSIRISMSGKGRVFDNILAERLWRTVKYEEIYLREYADGHELIRSLRQYFDYYNNHRPHSGLDYRAPTEVYFDGRDSLCSASATPSLRKANEQDKSLQLIPYTKPKMVLTMGRGQVLFFL